MEFFLLTLQKHIGRTDIGPPILKPGKDMSAITFTLRPLYPRRRNLGAYWTGGSVGLRAGL